MNAKFHLVRSLTLLLVGVVLLSGCSRKVTILQVPEFYHQSLKTIAVVPFRSPADRGISGKIIADQLAARLQGNGTYTVYNRNDLRTLMDERDLAVALSADPMRATQKFRALGNVQAILTGSVQTYTATSKRQPKQEPIYRYDKRGNQYIQGYRRFHYFFNSGTVSVSGVLIRVSDGTTIHATPIPASWKQSSEGEYPRYDEHQCLTIAANNVLSQLVEEFAVVRKVVKVNPGKALRTATELYDEKWTHCDKFDVDATRMIVVVNLPPACGRNKFRLVIVRDGGREVLAAKEFIWSRSNPLRGIGFDFSPRSIASRGGGAGRYVVKFYNGPTPVMDHKFRIVQQ